MWIWTVKNQGSSDSIKLYTEGAIAVPSFYFNFLIMRMKNEEAWESQSSNDESLVTKNVFINGKMEERVIALPKNYLMEQPKDKGKLLGSLDKEKLLGVTYN